MAERAKPRLVHGAEGDHRHLSPPCKPLETCRPHRRGAGVRAGGVDGTEEDEVGAALHGAEFGQIVEVLSRAAEAGLLSFRLA